VSSCRAIEQLLLSTSIRIPGHKFHDPCQNVGGMAVLPERPRLIVRGSFAIRSANSAEVEIAA